MTVVNNARGTFEAGTIGRKGRHKQNALESGAGTGTAMGQPGASVIVPKGTGVDKTFLPHHPDGLFPRSCGVLGAYHKDASVRIPYIYIIPPVMVADSRGPHRLAVVNLGAEIIVRAVAGVVREGIVHQFPVHQVARMQDGQSRKAVEGRCRHPVIVPHAYCIRVRVVQVQYGVGVGKRLRRRGIAPIRKKCQSSQ